MKTSIIVHNKKHFLSQVQKSKQLLESYQELLMGLNDSDSELDETINFLELFLKDNS